MQNKNHQAVHGAEARPVADRRSKTEQEETEAAKALKNATKEAGANCLVLSYVYMPPWAVHKEHAPPSVYIYTNIYVWRNTRSASLLQYISIYLQGVHALLHVHCQLRYAQRKWGHPLSDVGRAFLERQRLAVFGTPRYVPPPPMPPATAAPTDIDWAARQAKAGSVAPMPFLGFPSAGSQPAWGHAAAYQGPLVRPPGFLHVQPTMGRGQLAVQGQQHEQGFSLGCMFMSMQQQQQAMQASLYSAQQNLAARDAADLLAQQNSQILESIGWPNCTHAYIRTHNTNIHINIHTGGNCAAPPRGEALLFNCNYSNTS